MTMSKKRPPPARRKESTKKWIRFRMFRKKQGLPDHVVELASTWCQIDVSEEEYDQYLSLSQKYTTAQIIVALGWYERIIEIEGPFPS
jgi:hypothetical protein